MASFIEAYFRFNQVRTCILRLKLLSKICVKLLRSS